MLRATIPWNCKQIHRMVTNGSLVFDNAIQRGFVWDLDRMSLLIDSLLRDYPIPPFYTIRDGRTVQTAKGTAAVFDALDGRQRCETIAKFMNDGFALQNLEEPIVDDDGNRVDLNGLTYSGLTDALRNTLDTVSLNCVYFTDATEHEITEIMRRLNNGKFLTGQEHVRIRAKDLAGIRRIAKHPLLQKALSPAKINGYKDEDAAVKLYLLLVEDTPSFERKDVDDAYRTMEVTQEVYDAVSYVLDFMDRTYETLLVDGGRKAARKFISRAHLLTLAPVFGKAMADGLDAGDMAKFMKAFFDGGSPSVNAAYNAACRNGTDRAVAVATRIDALDKEYGRFLREKADKSGRKEKPCATIPISR